MPDCLYSIHMEQYTFFLTKGGNGRDILNRAYLVVGVLNGHQSGLPFQSPQQGRQIYFPFFADRQRIYSYSAIF